MITKEEKFREKLDVLNGDEHETTLELVYQNGKLAGVCFAQSSEPGLLMQSFEDTVFIPLHALGDIGALIYEALEVK